MCSHHPYHSFCRFQKNPPIPTGSLWAHEKSFGCSRCWIFSVPSVHTFTSHDVQKEHVASKRSMTPSEQAVPCSVTHSNHLRLAETLAASIFSEDKALHPASPIAARASTTSQSTALSPNNVNMCSMTPSKHVPPCCESHSNHLRLAEMLAVSMFAENNTSHPASTTQAKMAIAAASNVLFFKTSTARSTIPSGQEARCSVSHFNHLVLAETLAVIVSIETHRGHCNKSLVTQIDVITLH